MINEYYISDRAKTSKTYSICPSLLKEKPEEIVEDDNEVSKIQI
jgi:hypothetical protein